MNANNQTEYYYYLHLSKTDDPDDIESIFNNGLKSGYHYSLNSTLSRIEENYLQQVGLEKIILDSLSNNDTYDSAVIVKIPKKYLSEVWHRDGKIDPAVPMFREYHEGVAKWNAIFTPKLIQGIYCRKTNKSFTNPNFCPVFDMSGNQYSDEQIANLNSLNQFEWSKWVNDRKKCTFEQLYTGDKRQHTWDNVVLHYSQLYGISPRKMVKYKMPEEDRLALAGRTMR